MEEFVLFSILIFEDDTWSADLIYRGALDKCKECFDRIPAISYIGPKSVRQSTLNIAPIEAWNEAVEALAK